jgi:hypothetical protein
VIWDWLRQLLTIGSLAAIVLLAVLVLVWVVQLFTNPSANAIDKVRDVVDVIGVFMAATLFFLALYPLLGEEVNVALFWSTMALIPIIVAVYAILEINKGKSGL